MSCVHQLAASMMIKDTLISKTPTHKHNYQMTKKN